MITLNNSTNSLIKAFISSVQMNSIKTTVLNWANCCNRTNRSNRTAREIPGKIRVRQCGLFPVMTLLWGSFDALFGGENHFCWVTGHDFLPSSDGVGWGEKASVIIWFPAFWNVHLRMCFKCARPLLANESDVVEPFREHPNWKLYHPSKCVDDR